MLVMPQLDMSSTRSPKSSAPAFAGRPPTVATSASGLARFEGLRFAFGGQLTELVEAGVDHEGHASLLQTPAKHGTIVTPEVPVKMPFSANASERFSYRIVFGANAGVAFETVWLISTFRGPKEMMSDGGHLQSRPRALHLAWSQLARLHRMVFAQWRWPYPATGSAPHSR